MLVGFSGSGKSTVTTKIKEAFPGVLNRIETNQIHDFVNQTFPESFNDDLTITGESYELRQKTTKAIQKSLFEIFIKEKRSVIIDSCNLDKGQREKILSSAKKLNPNIKTILIYVKIEEKELLNLLIKSDDRYKEEGIKPTWVDLYEKIQKDKFEKPTKSEADYYIKYTRDNISEVIAKLKEIIK